MMTDDDDGMIDGDGMRLRERMRVDRCLGEISSLGKSYEASSSSSQSTPQLVEPSSAAAGNSKINTRTKHQSIEDISKLQVNAIEQGTMIKQHTVTNYRSMLIL